MKTKNVVVLLISLISSFSYADPTYISSEILSSKDLANRSILAFNSFSCSVWADLMGDQEASTIFLMNGNDHGKIYVEGLLDAKIEYDDKRRYIPGVMYPELKFTPNVDFMLGAIFQKVRDNTKAITYDFDAKGSDKYFSKAKESYANNGCAKILLDLK